MPLPADLSSASAALLFAQPPHLTDDDSATQDYLGELVDEGMHAALLEAADMCSALGGVFLRTVWDSDVADHAWLDLVPPDAVVPESGRGSRFAAARRLPVASAADLAGITAQASMPGQPAGKVVQVSAPLNSSARPSQIRPAGFR